MIEIRVIDHVPAPGGRYIKDGPYSGQWFREEILRPALQEAREKGEAVRVLLDGAPGYGSSFLEEAFGGAVRKGYVQARDDLVVESRSPLYETYARLAQRYLKQAKRQPVAA
ncbi:STAS-like domain-containing protein [Afifella pfennigii]|uniref:STAS-like domain-containing protein n=1 Tax=Afifella pfennigii TaxID=209897 RepID=UPI000689E3F7|nr:STAS-like domain-containing protein [Afifella pfennigii]